MTIKKPNILVIGSSNMDLIIEVPKLPKPGETIGSGTFFKKYGGKGANQAIAAQRAGGKTTFVTSLGQDQHGHELLAHYQREGLDTQFIKTSEKPTGVALINVSTENAQNSIAVASGANLDLTWDRYEMATICENQDYIIIQNEIPLNSIEELLKNAPKQIKIVYNPAPFFNISIEALRKVYILIINESEAEEIFKLDKVSTSDPELIKQISSLDIPKVVITMGAIGCYYWEKGDEKIGHIKGNKVNPKDTTGAGDTFCGYLTVCLAEGRDLEESIKISNLAASISILKIGAQESIPFRKDILENN